MSALIKCADELRRIIDATDDEHPCDLFALAMIERRLRERDHSEQEDLL